MRAGDSIQAEKDLAAKTGMSREDFLEIYDTFFQRIYNYAYYRTMKQNEAEEICSRTFLAALENIHRYEQRSVPIIVWLYKIAAHEVADFYRKKYSTVEYNEEHVPEEWPEDSRYEPESMLVKKSEKEQLLYNLKRLPPVQQQAIILRYAQDLSYREIAAVMEKTEGAVKQLLHRGLTTLRERMGDHEQ